MFEMKKFCRKVFFFLSNYRRMILINFNRVTSQWESSVYQRWFENFLTWFHWVKKKIRNKFQYWLEWNVKSSLVFSSLSILINHFHYILFQSQHLNALLPFYSIITDCIFTGSRALETCAVCNVPSNRSVALSYSLRPPNSIHFVA